jgi:polyhydroxyalkanoate synthesis repressor PhaR
MAYVIKRYANRKLYDTQTKRYLTLDEVSVLVRAGEQVEVVDADSGQDLTGQVLSKIIAEGTRKEGGLVPQKLLVDLIQRPREAVFDVVKSSFSTGQRTVEQFGGELGRLLSGVVGRDAKSEKATKAAGEELARMIDERLLAVIGRLDLPTRMDIEALSRRVEALESAVSPVKKPARAARKPAKKGGDVNG